MGAIRAAVMLLILSACPAWAQKQPILDYGYPEQPPRVFTDSLGKPAGRYPLLLDELLKRAGMQWRAASYPAPRLMKNLQSGETNFSILVRNKILEECCLFSSIPIWHDQLRVYWAGSAQPVSAIDDLNGKSLIVLAGFSYGGLINTLKEPSRRIALQQAESHEAAFAMLAAGRAAYVLDYEESSDLALRAAPIPGLNSQALDTVNMYLVLNKTFPDAAKIMKTLETQYKILHTEDVSGKYTKR